MTSRNSLLLFLSPMPVTEMVLTFTSLVSEPEVTGRAGPFMPLCVSCPLPPTAWGLLTRGLAPLPLLPPGRAVRMPSASEVGVTGLGAEPVFSHTILILLRALEYGTETRLRCHSHDEGIIPEVECSRSALPQGCLHAEKTQTIWV